LYRGPQPRRDRAAQHTPRGPPDGQARPVSQVLAAPIMALPYAGRLGDEGLQAFIVRGYHIVQPLLPPIFHEDIVAGLDRGLQDGLSGQSLAEATPLQALWDDTAVDGALTSIFGQNWKLDHHCHAHAHGPGAAAQSHHKDGAMRGKPRLHRPRLGLVLYYPQAVDDTMGPTAVQPGSQYLVDKDEAEWPELKLCVPAGTLVITHYDTYHRATENISDHRMRHMLKFIVWRQQEPDPFMPSWLAGDGIELHGRLANLPERPWTTPPDAVTASIGPHSAVIWRTIWFEHPAQPATLAVVYLSVQVPIDGSSQYTRSC
jgi:hypothetical protein